MEGEQRKGHGGSTTPREAVPINPSGDSGASLQFIGMSRDRTSPQVRHSLQAQPLTNLTQNTPAGREEPAREMALAQAFQTRFPLRHTAAQTGENLRHLARQRLAKLVLEDRNPHFTPTTNFAEAVADFLQLHCAIR